MHAPVRWLCGIVITGALVALGLSLFYFSLASRYDLDEVAKMPARTIIRDRDGKELDLTLGTSRRLITRKDIPDFMVKALQAREDARFFQHSGIDVRGLLRATLRNIKDREFTQGASTLSMQLARNSFQMRAKSFHRKLLEIALTLRVESRYSKDEILTHYLNRIYFGAGCNGVEEAAQTYFGHSVRDLNRSECAMLIGIIRGPHIYSPFRNPDLAAVQRDQVLDRMIAMGFITTDDKETIRALPIRLTPDEQRRPERSAALSCIRRELESIFDDEDIRLGGLQVSTTLDSAWQMRLETELERAVSSLETEKTWNHPTHAAHEQGKPTDYIQFAAVTISTKTGAILALVGSRDYLDSRYDRTVGARRDLGSAFEPFVAAAAAERGKLVLPGQPVQTGRQVGPAEVERLARRSGLTGPFLHTEDLFRGSVSATPMEMAVALAMLGNQGKRAHAYLVREIKDPKGEILYTAKPDVFQVLSSGAAQEASTVLEKRAGTRCFTGATGSERDAWTLRLGPKGATSIWVGFDQPTVITKAPRLKALLDEFVRRLGNE
jgi:membrane peptidoglycan carboxypeptidase